MTTSHRNPVFVIPITGIILALSIMSAYPDPLQAETGGEAVQLYNPQNTPSSTDGLVIATKTTAYTLPVATILPGAGYLIADTGWSGTTGLRDNLSWPDADFEAGLSLANTDGFIELRQTLSNGSYEVLDRLVWNSTVGKPREGYAWTSSGEAAPFFLNSSMQLVPFSIELEQAVAPPSILNISLPDDSPAEGYQLMGYARNLTVRASVESSTADDLVVTARLVGKEVELEREGNTSQYSGQLGIPALPTGEYELLVTATAVSGEGGESTRRLEITVLPTATIAIGRLELSGTAGGKSTGSLVATNLGNARRTVKLVTLPEGLNCEPPSIALQPGANATFNCAAAPGRAWSNATGFALVETG